jgi:hypothetical protein
MSKKKIRLYEIAHARSGDKGNHCNIGLIARESCHYQIIKEQVTAAKVKQHFAELCQGEVLRFELPNIEAFNFLLKDSLAGGATTSLRTDSQGKTFAAGLLGMWVEV